MQKLLSCINEIYQEFPQDENISLNKSAVADYSVPTTTVNGHRSRHTSGIFLPKFCLSQGVGIFLTPSKAEFVEWLISRNKPNNRTNKASRLTAVVETISHPLQGGNHLLITVKGLFKMLFKFLVLGKRRLKIATYANSEAEVRQLLNLDRNQAVFYARLKGRLSQGYELMKHWRAEKELTEQELKQYKAFKHAVLYLMGRFEVVVENVAELQGGANG